ncbi:TetR/AcrR family transcriptional regulator [Nonomuraea sp. NPDC050680]|uniref:TetR/AcrR family transcriptional regulator n=1 Tax=Nonomuraea sp. NPDC050680 TaxID=3154630 RepID=UPI0033BFBD6F
MPKLWNETIEAHRRTVHDAILETTAELVGEHGLLAVTMSQIAEKTGIGRATLYKYFPDVEAIVLAWHSRQITGHLEQLTQARDQAGDAGQRLQTMLETYALIQQQQHRGQHENIGAGLVALLHRGEHVAHAHRQLHHMLRDVLAEAAQAGLVRGDVAPDELATYCVHALQAAGSLPSKAAAHRLAMVTLDGLRPS